MKMRLNIPDIIAKRNDFVLNTLLTVPYLFKGELNLKPQYKLNRN